MNKSAAIRCDAICMPGDREFIQFNDKLFRSAIDCVRGVPGNSVRIAKLTCKTASLPFTGAFIAVHSLFASLA